MAESAEVPQPHVYASFSTKRELFLASLERACAHLEQQHSQSSAEVSCRHALVVFQAVALVRDGELRAPLLQRISALREILGESAFSALLERAAAQLLDAPAPGR